MRAPSPTRTSLGTRLWRAWDSDVVWSFRHSPVAIVAAVVALILLLGAAFAPLDHAAECVRRRQAST